MYSKKDWAKVGVLALLMVMCIVSFAFDYINVKVTFLVTSVQSNVTGFKTLFEGIPQMFSNQAGTVAVMTIIGLIASVVGLVLVIVNAKKKNEFAGKLLIAIFVISVAVCLVQFICFSVLNGAIPADTQPYCETTSGWFIMPIITAVLGIGYLAIVKLMED